MNKYTILDISTKEGLPDITDAHVSDAGDGKFTIYSETFVPGINTKWMRGADQVLAILHENKPGQYFVVASQDYIDALDPLSEGKTTADLGTATWLTLQMLQSSCQKALCRRSCRQSWRPG
jgi:hypothetical protein